VTWADVTGLGADLTLAGNATESFPVTLCDGKTAAIQVTDISTPGFLMGGGPIAAGFWQDPHSVYGDLNLSAGYMFNTRCLDASGSPAGAYPNSYRMTWDFGDTPLDYTNFFMVGQFWRPSNVLTITAYAADGVTVIANTAFAFEALRAQTPSYTFLEPLTWDPTTGTLYKASAGDQGPNSGYGFFNIPEGTKIGKIVFEVNDPFMAGYADALNWGIGCFGCIQ
jgi:hypothetical protein